MNHNQKSRNISIFLLFFVFTSACSIRDISHYGRVNFYGPNSKSFTFVVSEEYARVNRNSVRDKDNPKLTKAEAELLYNIMQKKKYCVNNSGKILFKITSRQEKIYDMTFAHLIEQNYNARPVTPVIYYGECLSRILTQKQATKELSEQVRSEVGR